METVNAFFRPQSDIPADKKGDPKAAREEW
jgi:hypothetical protein